MKIGIVTGGWDCPGLNAVSCATDALDRLHITAESHERVMVFEDFIWQALAAIGCRISDSASVALGYRGLGTDYEDGDSATTSSAMDCCSALNTNSDIRSRAFSVRHMPSPDAVDSFIFGTLLTRALDSRERHKLGAEYTPRSYVERLIRPTIIEPLREEWESTRIAAANLHREAEAAEALKLVTAFHRQGSNRQTSWCFRDRLFRSV